MDANDFFVLSEQRRELAAAAAIETDYDVAYELQIQETITASLNQSKRVNNRNILDRSNLNLVPNNNAVNGYLSSREISDYDKNRQKYDHASSRELRIISEKEWKRTTNVMRKPFFDGSTATSRNIVRLDENKNEYFRVYVKGSLSESGGKGENFRKGLIEVAIFDMKHGLVAEVSKEVVKGELRYEAVELKALIEGLNVIEDLGLKKIIVVCGNRFLYQCVTGKWQPQAGSSLSTLLDQVFVLQRKLTRCKVEHVEEEEVKTALKFAQKEAVSQTSRKGHIIRCGICLEDVCVEQMLSLHSCRHRYCFDCLKRYVETKLRDVHALPTCPRDGCKTLLTLEDSTKFLTKELLEIMKGRIREASIPQYDKIYCPIPTCSMLMSISEIKKQEEGSSAKRCTKCHRKFCMDCEVPWHSNQSCRSYRRYNPYQSQGHEMLMSLAKVKKWRQCQKCKNMVSLCEGCNHISCRCGHQFCYVCGAEWRNKRATCSCPLWHESMILRGENQQDRNRHPADRRR